MSLMTTITHGLHPRAESDLGSVMRIVPFFVVLIAVSLSGLGSACTAFGEEEGIALAIVYDTSGSMREPVRDHTGKLSPKYVIANRALMAIASQIQAFATNSAGDAPRKIYAGLYIFSDARARAVVDFGPFDAAAIQHWATNFSSPNGGTPLGNALKTAAATVLDSPLSRKHVLIITDGINTLGPSPSQVMPQVNRSAQQKQSAVSIHFVAFDVDAREFASVKKLGATVVGAADETQLNAQLNFILQNQILLEKEEPKK